MICLISLCFSLLLAQGSISFDTPRVVSVSDNNLHCGFPSLVLYDGGFLCAYREASSHRSLDGKIVIRKSKNSQKWKDVIVLQIEGADLRDPNFSIMPDGKIMLLTEAAYHVSTKVISRKSMVSFLQNGEFSELRPIIIDGNPNKSNWLWKINWIDSTAFGFNYIKNFSFLSSQDGINFTTICSIDVPGRANEADVIRDENKVFLAIARTEKGNGHILRSKDGKEWELSDCGYQLGGPEIIRLPDGNVLIGSRLVRDGKRRTALYLLKDNKLSLLHILPSDGDCSYPSFVKKNNKLYIAYYSSHKGVSQVYVTKTSLPF